MYGQRYCRFVLATAEFHQQRHRIGVDCLFVAQVAIKKHKVPLRKAERLPQGLLTTHISVFSVHYIPAVHNQTAGAGGFFPVFRIQLEPARFGALDEELHQVDDAPSVKTPLQADGAAKLSGIGCGTYWFLFRTYRIEGSKPA
jgi:hypothetical protein